ncbi:SDR family oxidoreductase [bacterium SCSIO 12643]|nr:SDR family oxidoreductase [bacterium SCSIO 12643]
MKTVEPKGKIALVSGANRGIGKAITLELLNKGAAKVYAGARNVETLSELVSAFGDRVVPIQLDVTDDHSIQRAASSIDELDILVNNAGIFALGGILSDAALSSLKSNLDINVWGLVKLSNAVYPQLSKSEGSAIINISSLAGLGNMPMAATYSVSKAAVHSITQGMRAELSDKNTLVMGVYPGPIDTDMAAGLEMDKDSPGNVAQAIVNGLKEGNEDVFPDVMSQQAGNFYLSSPKAVEQEFANFRA